MLKPNENSNSWNIPRPGTKLACIVKASDTAGYIVHITDRDAYGLLSAERRKLEVGETINAYFVCLHRGKWLLTLLPTPTVEMQNPLFTS